MGVWGRRGSVSGRTGEGFKEQKDTRPWEGAIWGHTGDHQDASSSDPSTPQTHVITLSAAESPGHGGACDDTGFRFSRVSSWMGGGSGRLGSSDCYFLAA